MIGKKIAHYKITEKLGEGGMGVVYKAEDTRLKRDVAIKFLPRQIAASAEERHRFKIEAQAAAALNHPNIATIHAIEEVDDSYGDGEMFIVMEYIEGKELGEIVGACGDTPLPLDQVINYATQIAAGLQAAHEKGIVHRDIKSANIMVTDKGVVKIMDFGLAKIGGSALLTKVGTTLGTAAYMSPEQAQGKETDHRTDIWAFGVVLYEMLTGRLPFKGEYEQAVIYSILNEEPDPVGELRSDVPEFLGKIVAWALAKTPEERYQDITTLIQDLKPNLYTVQPQTSITETKRRNRKKPVIAVVLSILAVILVIVAVVFFGNRFAGQKQGLSSGTKRIAVLPLKNLGPAEQEYFADGITGEITSKLSGLSGLAVIAHSSAMQYKNTTKSLAQIGKELGVDYVLEGTLQWEENAQGDKRIRVNPELIKISDETQVWSQPYEADFSSAFQLQADVASTVAEALNITLVKSERKSLHEGLTSNSQAYDLFLRALQFSSDISDEKRSRIAAELLLKAIALDSNFAAAYAELSTVQSNMYWVYFERNDQNLARSRANAEKALLLQPDLARAHEAMGNYYYHGKLNYEAALREYNEAVSLQPNYAYAYADIGYVRRRQGRVREGLAALQKAYDINPRDYNIVFSVGETHYLLREYDQALPFFEQAISLTPDAITSYLIKAQTYLLKDGNIQGARTVLTEALAKKIGEGDPGFKGILSKCDVLEGSLDDALKQIEGMGQIDDQYMFKPEALFAGAVYDLLQNKPLARKNYEAARHLLQDKIKASPEDSRLYSSLGIAYAGLGMKTEAIRAGKRGVELLPMSKEAWRGSFRVLDLAQIYTMVGEPDLALDLLDDLLDKPTDAISVALLKMDPTWASLRQHPRFGMLLKKYSSGESK